MLILLTEGQPVLAQSDPATLRLRVHDPSTLIKSEDTFWTFTTGDGIKTLRSTNLTDWQFDKPALSSNPIWAAEIAAPHRDYFWAPDIIKVNDRYLLYYSVSSWGQKYIRNRSGGEHHARFRQSEIRMDRYGHCRPLFPHERFQCHRSRIDLRCRGKTLDGVRFVLERDQIDRTKSSDRPSDRPRLTDVCARFQ